MSPEGDAAAIEALSQAWSAAEHVVVLSGAGLSTASGIPDFRSPGGRWEHYQPVTIQEFTSSEAKRREYWQYKGETWQLIQEAGPNPGHAAIAQLAAADRVALVVTQNVDGLHEASGIAEERLVNVHGTDSAVVCIACGTRAPRAAAQAEWEAGTPVPVCTACGGALKPATISFGQQLVPEDLERAFDAAQQCDLLVAVGTSLVVSPINQMFDLAARRGAETAILTASDTPYDAMATHRVRAPLERCLPAVVQGVLGADA